MRSLITISLLLVFALGCHSGNAHVFHVKAVNSDSPVDVIGTFEGKEYLLSVNRANVPVYVAYYAPIRTEDVGKDFQAEVKDGSLFIDIPDKSRVRYDIQSVKESTQP